MMEDKIEYFDIVNENDEVIGKIKESDQKKVRANQLRFINIIIINDENKIVVPKRSSNRKIFPNCYDFSVGGHVNSGENYDQAAYRELEEELSIKDVELEKIVYFSPYSSESQTFQTVYTLKYNKEINNYDKDGIDNIFFMSKEEIQKLMENNPELFKTDYFMVMKFVFENIIQ